MADRIGEPARFHGLESLAERKGWRNLGDTRRGDAYLSERTVFRDTATGCIAWRVTCDPAVSVNDYYDIPGWNANGSLLGFLSRRTGGGRRRWLMDANGDRLRPMPTADGREISTGFWSYRHPDRFYHALTDENGTYVVAENPFTGAREVIVSVDRKLGSMMPQHPSEEWFLFGDKKGNEEVPEGVFPPDTPSVAYVVGLDGTVQEVHFERRWHRLRFTKAADRRLFFNFDDPRTQWTILPDGTDRHEIPYTGGHPDWPMDGRELTYFNGGHVWGVSYEGKNRRSVIQLDSGGHGGPCLDGEWFVSDTPHSGKYPGSIVCFRTDGSGECRVLFKHMSSMYSHNERGWHPDHHATHPHPNSSPDGTKVVFNSDFLGEYADLYVVVNRLPDPPRSLRVEAEEGRVRLTWKVPRRCRETKGYHVYRREADGAEYERLTTAPVEGTEWEGAAGDRRASYVVTAQEWSGLEGEPSDEVHGTGGSVGAVRVALDTAAPDAPGEVRVEVVSTHTLRVRWDAVPAPDLDHYNVYCGKEAGFACDQRTRVGSPSAAVFVDWGLVPGTAYYYRVTAVDRAGNESTPSKKVHGETPSFEPVRVELTPGAAEVRGMQVQTVEGEQALCPGGDATWVFEVPRDGEYAIWGRSIRKRPKDETVGRVRPDTLDVCFDLCVDDDLEVPWTAWGFWGGWHWSPAGNMHTGAPETFRLTAGRHALRLKPGNDRSRVAGIVITDDPTWWPVTGMRRDRG